jgi:hypothetical protein
VEDGVCWDAGLPLPPALMLVLVLDFDLEGQFNRNGLLVE